MIVFIGADKREFDGMLARSTAARNLSWPLALVKAGPWNGEPALFVANGPGPKLAAEAVRVVIERQPVAALVSVGFCGGLNPDLAVGDIFIATGVVGVGPVLQPSGALAPHKAGALISTDEVAVTSAQKTKLRQTGADAVEMEAGAVAQAAKENHIPFYCVRVVTDAADEDLPLDFNRMRDRDGRFSRARILAAACRRPGVIFPELMRFNERCKNASEALGDFVANCHF